MRRAGWTLLTLGGAALAWRAWRGRQEVSLKGAVCLVTGASHGLGYLIAGALAREGARLVICARHAELLESARRHLEAEGAEVLAVTCDVSDRAQVDALAVEAIARFGGLDVVVNNAGVLEVGPFETMHVDDFVHDLSVNFWGPFNVTMAVLPALVRSRIRRLVFIDSIGGRVAIPHLLPYSCAKFALRGFAEGLRTELAKAKIAVTVVLPGLMRTGSALNARFKGPARNEFTWFGVLASTPLTTMDAERAAERIVTALKRGEAEVTLSWQAKVLGLAHDLFPSTTMDLLGVVNRLLPAATSAETRQGRETPLVGSRLMRPLERQAARANQFAAPPR
ncbi:MAG TPA: SDR family NAD(P)-dependent oxidoreductase [Oscillatoriaceae cyanobacterium]